MKKTTLILFVLLFANSLYVQANWFVSTSGTDAPGNGTLANPFKTITYASTFLTAGDTCFVRGGTYTNATYNDGYYWNQDRTARISAVNGTASQYIVIMPYNNELPVLKGDGDFIFQVTGCSYLKIQGLEIYGETENISLALALQYQFAFRRTTNTGANTVHENRVPVGTNTPQSGLEDLTPFAIFRPYYFFTHGIVVQNSDHIDIVKNVVHHVPGEGIRFAGSDYFNCNNNIVHNNARRSSTGVHGISCYTLASIDNSTATKVIFNANTVYDNYNEMASWSEQKTIFDPAIDEGKGLTIQRSFAAGGNWDFGRILFVNNVAYRNGLAGIHVNDGDRIDIVNNTVYQNNRYGTGNNLGISVAGGNDVRIYNNIVQSDLSWGGFTISATPSTTGLVVSHNLVNGGLDGDVGAVDVSTIFGTAQFVNVAANDFRLTGTSLGINNALASVAPSKDYFGFTRDAQPDRGAFEYFIALPVSLLQFSAAWENDRQVMLYWKTAAEVNNAFFEMEHAVDGVSWKTIGRVMGKGDGVNISTYQLLHDAPVPGINYYRLKQVDRNGAFTYSTVVTATRNPKSTVKIYPNPAFEQITVTGPQNTDKVTILNGQGGDVSGNTVIQKLNGSLQIDISRLPQGAYFVKINNHTYPITKIR
jgi:parallel beta-helix repeat protein